MAGKTTRDAISTHSEGPGAVKTKTGEKVTRDHPETTKNPKAPTKQEQDVLDKSPVLDQREYIVDGNTAVLTRDVAQGEPIDPDEYEKDRAEAAGLPNSTHVPPLDDRVAGLVEPGGGNPAAGRHESGPMRVPDAEGDPDSIRAWNARKAAEAAFKKANR